MNVYLSRDEIYVAPPGTRNGRLVCYVARRGRWIGIPAGDTRSTCSCHGATLRLRPDGSVRVAYAVHQHGELSFEEAEPTEAEIAAAAARLALAGQRLDYQSLTDWYRALGGV